MHFFSWLTQIEDTDWTHVDNQWIVDRLLDIHYSQNNIDKSSEQDLAGPHYEDQWWIGARSYVSTLISGLVEFCKTFKFSLKN